MSFILGYPLKGCIPIYIYIYITLLTVISTPQSALFLSPGQPIGELFFFSCWDIKQAARRMLAVDLWLSCVQLLMTTIVVIQNWLHIISWHNSFYYIFCRLAERTRWGGWVDVTLCVTNCVAAVVAGCRKTVACMHQLCHFSPFLHKRKRPLHSVGSPLLAF